MLLTVKAKLLPTPYQKEMLLNTMERFNKACNCVSDFAYKQSCFHYFRLHQLMYKRVREDFQLSAQMAIRCIGKVAEAYKCAAGHVHGPRAESSSDGQTFSKIVFRPHSAIVYDQRNMSWKSSCSVSLSTLVGRTIIPVVFGLKYRTLTPEQFRRQVDLIYLDKEFYICCVYEVVEKESIQAHDVIGVDLGIVNLATTSDGYSYSGDQCEKVRARYERLKSKLQKVYTKSAKRHLRKISAKEKRFKRNVNHCISKALVSLAEGTERAIALEDLAGIRSRTTVKKDQRDRHTKWAFRQLRSFVEYKAKMAGVPLIFIDPKGTSRTCSVCGYEDKRNRKSQSEFVCLSCGHSADADVNAAKNIRRAAVVQPIVVRHDAVYHYDVGTARSCPEHGQTI